MANLKIKGIDEELYKQIKGLAAEENRSIGQEVLFLIKKYLSNRKQFLSTKTPAQTLLDLAESWDDPREADELISDI